jgi:ABC-type sugar transport system ATPase subunit
VKLIRKHFPERFDDLVKVKETPIKAAIRNLSGGELQKLGIKVQSAGEVVFITDALNGVDKLVKALLKGAEAAQEEEAEA